MNITPFLKQCFLARYFVCMDVFLVGQFIYFQPNRGVAGRHRGPDMLPKTQEGSEASGHAANKSRLGAARNKLGSYRAALAAAIFGGLLVLSVHWWWTAHAVVKTPAAVQKHDECAEDPATEHIGAIFGSVSAMMYVSSRIPQIYKNWRRKNTEGLAVRTFMMALSGNGLYTLSVLARAREMHDILKAAPWLVGSAGTMSQDAVIIYQTLRYRHVKHNKSDADIPLLGGNPII
ncbi:unnamed protein product [Ostreobium quekettii]|uniref:Uncharacterized protein n=1 Tax=Ostreobium quekettii TaxID=121088 RepID=A0A8S1IUD2_9CHLO|nr:unnamed protein product [Ostreobium quekettii]